MAIGDTNFNPGQVMLGGGNGPYMQTSAQKNPSSFMRKPLFPTPTLPGGGNVPTNGGSPVNQNGFSNPVGGPGGPQNGGQVSIGSAGPLGPAPTQPTQTSSTLLPETVRATGSGPFDPAFRQNLATYAGGQFQRPGGNLSFDPTGQTMPNAQPTGLGNAPVPGMGNGLLQMALGGQPFNVQPQMPTPPASGLGNVGQTNGMDALNWWLGQMGQQGNGFGLMQQ